MASNINPNNIDTTYPVAGQDNDSQGFRDNFTTIKNNFTSAREEITDLQNTAVLKPPSGGSGGSSKVDNDLTDTKLTSAEIRDFSETVVAIGTTSGNIALDHSQAHYFTATTNGTVSAVFSNLPPAGEKGRIQLEITISDVAHTLTLPSQVSKGIEGIQGLVENVSGDVITFAEAGDYLFEFTTVDGGTTIHIEDKSRPKNNVSAEDVADAGAISLTSASSYFTTAGSETATLAAGTPGQVKTLVMAGDGGDMVVTVDNAGWKATGNGTITFNDIGDACTLQYINNKWYATGVFNTNFA